MRWIICFFILATTVFSQNLYQQHLPKKIYEKVTQQEFVNEDGSESSMEKQYGQSIDTITINIDKGGVGQCVFIDYWCGQPIDNFGGIQVGYKNCRVIGYSIFDEMGRDYIAEPPFSRDDEENIELFILGLIDGGYLKIRENF